MIKRDLYYERIPTKTLREDVKFLGPVLGNVIKEQEGESFYNLVEKIRKLSKANRKQKRSYKKISKEIKSINPKNTYKIARAFNDCLSTLLTVFQTTIVTAPGFGSLVPELIDLLSTPKPSATLFATKFATALNNFTSAAVISGVVPGTPPVPFTGPPS